jgi:hypothetical protein
VVETWAAWRFTTYNPRTSQNVGLDTEDFEALAQAVITAFKKYASIVISKAPSQRWYIDLLMLSMAQSL